MDLIWVAWKITGVWSKLRRTTHQSNRLRYQFPQQIRLPFSTSRSVSLEMSGLVKRPSAFSVFAYTLERVEKQTIAATCHTRSSSSKRRTQMHRRVFLAEFHQLVLSCKGGFTTRFLNSPMWLSWTSWWKPAFASTTSQGVFSFSATSIPRQTPFSMITVDVLLKNL